MNILKDMELFVRVVHCDGLAAAGRELGMTPSSVTMHINNLEKHYQVKLLTRTTRSISLTEAGREFYHDSVKMLEGIDQIENRLMSSRNVFSGPIRITATSDLGRQHVAPVINEFIEKHPDVRPYLNLSDAVTDVTENNIDIAVRYGVPTNSHLVADKIADSRRVLCASPEYLERAGVPQDYTELTDHACLTMVQIRRPMSKWYFTTPHGEKSLTIQPSRSCDDGAQIRQWALEGAGIGLKSIWDVAGDLKDNRLVTVLDQFKPDYQSSKTAIGADLFLAYPDQRYLPARTSELIKVLKNYFERYTMQHSA